jgi:hypothetical protein
LTGGPFLGLLWADTSGLYVETTAGAIAYSPLAGGSTTSVLGTPPSYTPDLGGTVWAGGGTAYYVLGSQSSTTLALYRTTPPAMGTLLTSYPMERQGSLFGDPAGLYLLVTNGTGTQGVYKVDPASGAQTLLYRNMLYGVASGVQALDATSVYFATVSASVFTLYSHPR